MCRSSTVNDRVGTKIYYIYIQKFIKYPSPLKRPVKTGH